MPISLIDKTVAFLQKNPEEKFTAQKIAKWIFETYPDECRQKQKNSKAKIHLLDNDTALLKQIAAEIGAQRLKMQKQNSKVKTTESRPRKYYFTKLTDSQEIDQAESNKASIASKENFAKEKLKESELYPILSEFLLTELRIYSKRIDEKKSRNSKGHKGNRWLHPDLVGMEDLSSDWHREIKDCVKQYSDKKTKLWSFEVKAMINRSNVREVFFQAVSNSSWANFGYLVASEIGGANTLKELRMLSSLHGIGFIQLNAEELSESQIIIPASERSEIDWDTANRLAKENDDFLKYIKIIRKFYQTNGEISEADWDCRP